MHTVYAYIYLEEGMIDFSGNLRTTSVDNIFETTLDFT